MEFPDEMTLGEARDWLRRRVRRGAHCPICKRWTKIYPRSLVPGLGRALLAFAAAAPPGTYFHGAKVLAETGLYQRGFDYGQLKHWGLIEPQPNAKDPTKRTLGHWRLTGFGWRFAQDLERVQEGVTVYADTVLKRYGREVGIRDCLRGKFDYAEIMASAPDWGDEPPI